jgi:hypothetical protein
MTIPGMARRRLGWKVAAANRFLNGFDDREGRGNPAFSLCRIAVERFQADRI